MNGETRLGQAKRIFEQVCYSSEYEFRSNVLIHLCWQCLCQSGYDAWWCLC